MINLPPAGGAVIDSAASRLRHRLMTSAMFTEVEVETTEDADRLLVASVRYRPGTLVSQVSSYLEAVWVSELRLSGLDAFHFTVKDSHIELESVTGDQASGYFLSLRLIADMGSAEDFETRLPADETRPPLQTDVRTTRRRWLRR